MIGLGLFNNKQEKEKKGEGGEEGRKPFYLSIFSKTTHPPQNQKKGVSGRDPEKIRGSIRYPEKLLPVPGTRYGVVSLYPYTPIPLYPGGVPGTGYRVLDTGFSSSSLL